MNRWYVYALFRPDNGDVFYIGASSREKRIREHLANFSGKKGKMVKAFLQLGYKEIPMVVIRDYLNVEDAAMLETQLIGALGRLPYGPLTNIDLYSTLLTDEVRKKMSASARLVNRNTEAEERRIARMSDSDVRAKMSVGAKQRERTPEFEAKRLAAATSPEAKAKRSEKMKNRGWITDGITDSYVKLDEPIPAGWRRGRHLTVTDTELERRAAEKTAKRERWLERNRTWRWITDGETSRKVPPEEVIPEGWRLGRTF